MCNLYSNTTTQETMRQLFDAKDSLGNWPAQPAIFPDGEVAIVRINRAGERELIRARWGWARTKRGWVTNARDFGPRAPWPNVLRTVGLRCLVPATSFAEYHPTETTPAGHKAAVWFRMTGEAPRPPFAFAGFMRRWHWEKDGLRRKSDAAMAEQGEQLVAMTFLTTEPNATIAPIHPRSMPVILRPEDYACWLSGEADDTIKLQRPLPDDALEIAAVGEKMDPVAPA